MRTAHRLFIVMALLSGSSNVWAQTNPPATGATPPTETSAQGAPTTQATVPAAEPAPMPTTAATVPALVAPEMAVGPLMAGYHNDLMFMASADHNWFIIPSGRLQLDGIGFVGDGVTSDYYTNNGTVYHRSDVKDGFILRRARIEVLGGMFDRFTYMLGAEFTGATPVATDLIFDARVVPELHFQLGQFDAPFTMENRTSDKYLDLMERSLAVRGLGIPTNKEIGLMAWGELPSRLFYYSVGIFNGDGQNLRNVDNNVDVMGRAFLHPFITMGGPLANLQIGGSFRWGLRGASVNFQYPNMTSLGGFTLFNSQIASGANPVTIVPDNIQFAAAGELDLPIGPFDIRGEYVYVNNQTREMPSLATNGAGLMGNALRLGNLEGSGYYVQLGWWFWGSPGVNGRPGYEDPPALHLERRDPPPRLGAEALLRLDVVDFHYNGGSRSGQTTMGTADGHYDVYVVEGGVNFWATKHLRFSLVYLQYLFPGQPGNPAMPMTEENHMHGPHNGSDTYGEITARVGLAL